ncbi:hypothetical protein KIW84_040746 [Lathyrus oleraceus]|uniref:Uncharacterized protein n=1 Tax=Pisum sativum TaxID=3888 RepID=A0A9D4XAW3_PEA|nr:hypothetical protein KIW84_040746 [Pisum sativum]
MRGKAQANNLLLQRYLKLAAEKLSMVKATLPPPVKPLDGGSYKPHSLSLRDILTKGQRATTMKERVDLIEKGLMKVYLEGGNRLLSKVTMDERHFRNCEILGRRR